MQLVELLARRDDSDSAACVTHLLGDLFASQRGIEGNIGSTDGQRGEIGDGPLPAVLADKDNAVTLLHAKAKKRRGQSTDTLIHLVRGDGMPVAEFVLPEDCARVACPGDANKEVVDRGDRRNRSHCTVY